VPETLRRDNDLVLDPTQYAYSLDATKGQVVCYVGPTRVSLAETDRPVAFVDGAFKRCDHINAAIQSFPVAGEGDYVVLENPAKNGELPKLGTSNANVELLMGRTVNIHGPASFPLWPGQSAKVVQGHHLRSNQYLVAVVYNEEEAQKNWATAVMKVQETGDGDEGAETPKPNEGADTVKAKVGTLTTGKRIVIKGTEISFFMPPTGIEVVPEQGQYVRDAVTLEMLEYSILIDEGGKKRYERGPKVVFPEPTEVFVRRDMGDGEKKTVTRKFKAIELNEISGIYVQVISSYEDKEHPLPDVKGEIRTDWDEGEELFVTGKEQRIYFPRPEHGIIRYAGQKTEKMYAIAIPEGEARYVLNRLTGAVSLVKGPSMFLPDPRKEVIVRRVLQQNSVDLWFPDNAQAKVHNQQLASLAKEEKTSGHVSEQFLRSLTGKGRAAYKSRSPVMNMMPTAEAEDIDIMSQVVGASVQSYGAGFLPPEEAHSAVAGDEIQRQQGYTPPRMVVLDTKYEGAVLIDVWQGYAVQVKSKTGKREVVVGPQPRLLAYDEGLDVLTLSKGTPKSDKNRLKTVYLQVRNNRVSDVMSAETADLVSVGIGLAYRVNFEGEPAKWFEVEDYVRLLCEHARSLVRNHMKKVKIEDFMADSVAMVRDMLLGRPDEEGNREGLVFKENGMVVTDVEMLQVTIGDADIAKLLVDGQHTAVEQAIELKLKAGELERQEKLQDIARKISTEVNKTTLHQVVLAQNQAQAEQEAAMQELAAQLEQRTEALNVEKANEAIRDESSARALVRKKADVELDIGRRRTEAELDMEVAQKRSEAQQALILAITPDLIAAMQVHGDKVLTASLAEKLTPLASLTGEGVDETFKKLMGGLAIGDIVGHLTGNGSVKGIASGRNRLVEKKD